MDIPIAANILGVLGAVCWSIQLIPQIIINYRRHNTTGLQSSMMMLWACAGVPLGVYNIVQEFNIALRIQPQILTLLSLTTWIQCYYYDKQWSIPRCLSLVIPIACLMGGIQAASIVALKISHHHHHHHQSPTWPTTLTAILSALLLCSGVLCHYHDIYTQHTVRGISFIFVFIDALGDLTSLISIFFQKKLDILGMVIYGTELALWIGVFACGGYFNLVPWVRRKMRRRRTRRREDGRGESGGRMEGVGEEGGDEGGVVELHEMPSSTSVFRTPSSEQVTRRPPRPVARSAGSDQI